MSNDDQAIVSRMSPVEQRGAANSPTQRLDYGLGGFAIKQLAGRGTYGRVFMAEHKATNRDFALKFVDYKQGGDKHSRRHNRRVEREVKLLHLLHHPHIVRIYDVMHSSERVVMVQEYLGSNSLFDYIQHHGYLREVEACRIFRQLVSAVDYLHRNCIVHRDLKPSNIMMDHTNQVRLIDFGFANIFEWDKQLSTFCGSPSYASPEIVCGIRYTGPEVDIWSMGVILYCMLCGRLPFEGATQNDIFAKVASGRFTMPCHVSKEAQGLLQRMLTVDPRKRISMRGIVDHPWANRFDDRPIDNYLPLRSAVVLQPCQQSLQKMPVYGLDITSTAAALSTSNMAMTPVVCIYHLIDEARRRRESRQARNIQANMVTSSTSVYSADQQQ
ncbi:hypothetical protein LPJ61_000527 [Coemansia biformis]|uniref:Protein kinase domain-containing protein n=1 Tax=Coemansia biformis TaxID=1286918 RepID=A0A9W7YIP6_9FUNG|nr:hypothetical protein LPJ61_000527 [Coemansia biformis]